MVFVDVVLREERSWKLLGEAYRVLEWPSSIWGLWVYG